MTSPTKCLLRSVSVTFVIAIVLATTFARASAQDRITLVATGSSLPEPLYVACGYQEIERFAADTRAGVRVPLVRMGKRID